MTDIFDHDSITLSDSISERIEIAIRQIAFARRYTSSLIEDLADDDWYWTPGGAISDVGDATVQDYRTHIAWQCGHLAMAQYGLTLFRQRGRADVDSSLMSGKFRKLFMRGTEPSPDREKYPTPSEISAVMDRVYQQMLVEVVDFDDKDLDEVVDAPHAAFNTRYGALLFAGHHEMVHAGQIGMLRRLMGKPALR